MVVENSVSFIEQILNNKDVIELGVNSALLLVTIISAFVAFLAYKNQKKRRGKEEACNLAKYYAKNVISKYSLIDEVLKKSGLFEEIKRSFPMKNISSFNQNELIKFFDDNKDKAQEFWKSFHTIDPKIILSANMASVASALNRHTIYQQHIKNNEETGKNEIINGTYLQQDFRQNISNLLNELEWFSMSCRYGIADEKLLYQSIHQTFLSTVWMLYVLIAWQNKSNEDKYYTNIIWLFTLWRKRLNKIVSKSDKKRDRIIRRAQRQIEGANPHIYSGTKI